MSFFKIGRDSKSGRFKPVGSTGMTPSVSSSSKEKAHAPVFQTFTLPDGKTIRHMRKDAFDRAIDGTKKG